MTQVKTFFEERIAFIEGNVNKFLKENPKIEVCDIKYSEAKSGNYYTAMIIYKIN